jgi:hypothetical protein
LDSLLGREAPQARTAAGSAKRPNAFQSVSVSPCAEACQAALLLRDKPFLVQKAPRLPLPECSRPTKCTCRFSKHIDRRSKEDKRSPYADSRSITYAGSEKRGSPGRRTTDSGKGRKK